MKRVRYSVAVSLDGYIAGPKGEYDWIVMDPEIDFQALYEQFDTVFVGRKSYAAATQGGKADKLFGMDTFVFSHTLNQDDYSKITIVADGFKETVTALKEKSGKDIWLFGGGVLFRSLLQAGLVDSVEVAVIPALLGQGIPLLPGSASLAKLKLKGSKVYEKTGTVMLEYAIEPR